MSLLGKRLLRGALLFGPMSVRAASYHSGTPSQCEAMDSSLDLNAFKYNPTTGEIQPVRVDYSASPPPPEPMEVDYESLTFGAPPGESDEIAPGYRVMLNRPDCSPARTVARKPRLPLLRHRSILPPQRSRSRGSCRRPAGRRRSASSTRAGPSGDPDLPGEHQLLVSRGAS